jgi:hypothetical protein
MKESVTPKPEKSLTGFISGAEFFVKERISYVRIKSTMANIKAP